MPLFNPNSNKYTQIFTDNIRRKGFNNDAEWNFAAQIGLMQAQYDLDDDWYNAHESASAKYDEFRQLGINPYSAARAVLGNPSYDTGSTAPSASGGGSLSGFADVMNGFNSISQQAQMITDQFNQTKLTNAQVHNLDADTASKNVVRPTLVPEAESRTNKNNADAASANADIPVKEAQVGVLNAEQSEIVSRANLQDKQREQIVQAMSRFNEVTDTQLNMWRNQSNLFFEEAKTQMKQRQVMDADILLKDLEGQEASANANLANSKATTEPVTRRGIELDNDYKQVLSNFAVQNNIPLGVSDVQYMSSCMARGDFASAQNYANCMFDCAQAQSSGERSGSLDSFGSEYKAGPLGTFSETSREGFRVNYKFYNINGKRYFRGSDGNYYLYNPDDN